MLPVSILVPHKPSRRDFFNGYCLPSLRAQGANEILVDEDPEAGVAVKRNRLAAKARNDYLFFCDDDVVLRGDCIQKMLQALYETQGKDFWTTATAFAYCDYLGVCWPGVPHPTLATSMGGSTGLHRAREFCHATLRQFNYISTMSLLRRIAFTGFDETLPRYMDWDLWLTLTTQGHTGVYIPEVLFQAHYIDAGITATVPQNARALIEAKHKL